jgi:uncharacterized protein YdhG (YjbR/CyaY superfamily)
MNAPTLSASSPPIIGEMSVIGAMTPKPTFSTIVEYIVLFAPNVQAILQTMRETIQAAAPQATEKISYQMPAFYQEGNLVYFGASQHHLGFYPVPSAIRAFQDELTPYAQTTGTVKFLYNEPLPLDLISRMVQFRVAENLRKAQEKAEKKKKRK